VVIRLDRIGVLREGHELRFLLIVAPRERMALPGLGQEDPTRIGVALVVDADEVEGFPLVPVGRPEDRFGGLTDRVIGGRRDDDRDLLGRIRILPEVVDRFVPIGVLLCGEICEVIEPRLVTQVREDILDVVGPDNEPGRVQMIVACERTIIDQRREVIFRYLDRRLLSSLESRTHGESAQL